MRQTLGSENEAPNNLGAGGSNFRKMLREGRSFSGKERNCVFLNTLGSDSANGRFATISAVSGLDYPEDGRGVVHIDWDQDGDLDLWFSNRNEPRLRFLRNDLETENHFLQFSLTGNGSDTNRNAVGALIRVTTRTAGSDELVRQIRELRAGDGFISQGTLKAHFGIEANSELMSVEVRWPKANAEFESFDSVQLDGRFKLVQGTGKAQAIPSLLSESVVQPSQLKAPGFTEKQRIPLLSRFAAPPLNYKSLDGDESLTVPDDSQQVTLLNLWSTNCGPCLKELKEFSERYQELQGNGVRVVALCIDELEGGLFDPEAGDPVELTKAAVERLKMPFTTGMASPELIGQIQRLHNSIIESVRPLPLPTSILIDREGRLDVIYKGTIDIETLIADSKPLSEQTIAARFIRSSMLPGKLIDHPSAMKNLEDATAQAHIKLAREFAAEDRIDEAINEYEQGLKVLNNSAFMQNDLATLLTYQGKFERAIQLFQRAIDLEPQNIQYRVNLTQSFLSTNQIEMAEKEAKKLITTHPKSSEGYFYLGVIQNRLKQFEEAKLNFSQAIERAPNNARAHFSLGSILMQQNDWEAARKALETAATLEPNEVVILVSLSKALLRLDMSDLAESRVRQAINVQPGFAEAHYQLGRIQMSRGENSAARASFNEALRIEPGHRPTMRAMSELR